MKNNNRNYWHIWTGNNKSIVAIMLFVTEYSVCFKIFGYKLL